MDLNTAINRFGALSQETRLETVRLLVRRGIGGMAAGEIAAALDVPQNTMSSHLSILVHAGLLESRRDGRSIIYRMDFGGMRGLLEFLLEDCCHGKPKECGPMLDKILPGECPPQPAGRAK